VALAWVLVPAPAALVQGVLGYLALVCSSNESFLLEPLAVNLVNAHEASDEIHIFLISKSARFLRPGKLTRRFGVIGIISGIPLNSGVWGHGLSFIHQNRVIDRDSRESAELSNDYLPARQ
jgi:hypothetical protein